MTSARAAYWRSKHRRIAKKLAGMLTDLSTGDECVNSDQVEFLRNESRKTFCKLLENGWAIEI